MLVLFVLAIVVFVLPFALPTPPPIVTRFTATALFSPNGDGARDVARISVRLREASTVTIEVQHDGRVVRRLADEEPRPPGWFRLSWNGRDDDGRAVADGSYALKLRVRSGRKRFNTTRRIVVDTMASTITTARARSVPPPGRGQCVIVVETSGDGQAVIEASPVEDGPPIRTLGPRPVKAGEQLRWNWNGRDAPGALVAPGLYRIDIRVADTARNRSSVTRSCWIGQLVGRAVPARPRARSTVGVVLRRPDGSTLPGATPVSLSLHRRVAEPGPDLRAPIGRRVAGPVTGRAGRVRVDLPEGARARDLWLVARADGGVALIGLRS